MPVAILLMPVAVEASPPPTSASPPAGPALVYYPSAAKAAGIEGSAEIACQRNERGALVGCVVTSENPKARGFGSAALAIAANAPPTDVATLSAAELALDRPYQFAFKLNPPSIEPDLFGPQAGNPHWLTGPSPDDFASAYPRRAAARGISGRTIMTCRVNATGRMDNCSVTSETPPGLGFGDAALKLAQDFKLSRFTADGRPTYGSIVTIPIGWRSPE